MKPTLLKNLLVLLCVGYTQLIAAPIKQQPAPVWIKPVAIPSFSGINEKDVEDGYHYLLFDEQVHTAEKADYCHLAIQIVNDIGVQNASEIELSYDPGYQQLMIHYIRVVRAGKTINKLDLKDIKTIQQEKDLYNRIYDGRLTAYISLKDIRKGDLLDYAYTIQGRNPVLGEKYSGDFTTEFNMPVSTVHYAVNTPVQSQLHTRQHITDFPEKTSTSGNTKVHEWTFAQPKGKEVEDQLPDWLIAYGFIEVSEYQSWREVLDWALNIYAPAGNTSPELEAKIAELNTGSTEHKIMSALHFVQDEIRYMGFEVGINSHQPNPANRVFSQRFGDCKDKANLLCHMLNNMGIEAYPNLVNSEHTKAIGEWLPSPLSFNHVTVCVIVNGQRYWLDPTDSYQGGKLKSIQYPNYGKTLLIKKGEQSLTDIPYKGIRKTNVYETFVVNDTTGPIILRVVTTYHGIEADRTRYQFSSSSLTDIEKEYTDFYKGVYGEVSMENRVETSDDKDENIFKVFEEYTIRDVWTTENDVTGRKHFEVTPQSLFGLIHLADIKRRTYPYSLSFPFDYTQTIEVKFPHAVEIFPESGETTDEHFNYSYQFKNEGQNSIVVLTYHFETLKDVVAPEKSHAYFTQIESIKKLNAFHVPWDSTITLPAFNWGKVNTLMVVVALLLIVGLTVLCFVLYKFDVQPKAGQLFGKPIGGWLILTGIVLCISLPVRLAELITHRYFSLSKWETLTSPASTDYHPLWGTLTILQMTFPLILLVTGILLIALFTARRSSFPSFFIGFLLAGTLFSFINLIIAYTMPGYHELYSGEAIGQLLQSLFGLVIWIPYLTISERVKETFIYTYNRNHLPVSAPKPIEQPENDAV